MKTSKVAKALEGEKLYQERARLALPILVRQAHAGSIISYESLATELGMPNPRNLNYPLGSIGTALKQLSEVLEQETPQIQCLVVNQKTGMPGDGIGGFISGLSSVEEFKKLPLRNRRLIVDGVLARVFAYPHWNEVLDTLGLKPSVTSYKATIESAAKYQGGGESELHKALKKYVSETPQAVGLPARTGIGEIEYPLPSGDYVDILFSHASVRTAVEVKSRISEQADIVRGLFQCVKYQAILQACISVENSNDSANAILALESTLPNDLRVLRNTLDVTVVENVRKKDRKQWN